jgi:transposase
MRMVVVGTDLGKKSCSLVGLSENGTAVLRRRLRREGVIAFFGQLPACVVAMALAEFGHVVRLMSPEYVRPYVKAQKNDGRDAEAIAEVATRPTMHFVELKSEEQLDMQTLHRVRDRLVAERERGHVAAQGHARLRDGLTELLGGEADALSPRMMFLLADMRERWAELDQRIAAFDVEFAACAKADERARRLTSIPGIGTLNATALVAAVGDARSFERGRDLAAWLGLVPRQVTTEGRPKLLVITKRGSKYLRKMLIPGRRSSDAKIAHFVHLRRSYTCVGAGLSGLRPRSHPNTAVVALAAKMARTVWALLRHKQIYCASPAAS